MRMREVEENVIIIELKDWVEMVNRVVPSPSHPIDW